MNNVINKLTNNANTTPNPTFPGTLAFFSKNENNIERLTKIIKNIII